MPRQETSKHRISSQLSPHRAKRAGFARADMLLIAVFAAGILCVYVLGRRVSPRAASGQRPTVQITAETQLKSIGKSNSTGEIKPGKRMGIVDTFYYQAKQRQIPIEALLGNPFISRSPRLAAPVLPEPKTNGNEGQSDSLTEAIVRAKGLKLQSAMVGSGGATAMISGQLFTVGQQIRGWTVVQIEPRRVALAWRDQKFVLEMSR